MITAKNINVNFKGKPIFINSEIEVSNNDFIIIFGKNGEGKSVLIKILLKILNNKNVKNDYKTGEIFYLAAETNLYQDLSIKNNIKILKTMYKTKFNKKQFNDKFFSLLELFNITQIYKMQVRKLSSGQRKKINFILSQMFANKIIVLDEPFANLDPNSIKLLEKMMNDDHKKNKRTYIVTTHININVLNAKYYLVKDKTVKKSNNKDFVLYIKDVKKRGRDKE